MRFPLKDVTVRRVGRVRQVAYPLYADSFWQMSQTEFAMQVEGVGSFYACDGKEVEYSQATGVDRETLELYLNGSTYGAILHQRKILPLHGSSFLHQGRAILICGDAGAGKSSLTASFCLNGADFLTDDVTPVVFREGKPYIWAMSDRIKLWRDTLEQLEKDETDLHRIYPEVDKYYLPMTGAVGDFFRLDQIYIIEIKQNGPVEFDKLLGSDKFAAVRSEIYRYEYLQGMPDNEQFYFKYLMDICNNIEICRVNRPEKIGVKKLMHIIRERETVGNRFW